MRVTPLQWLIPIGCVLLGWWGIAPGVSARPPDGPQPAATADADQPPTPLPRAHAHNDYLHPRPLLDALERGFVSVEADVFLRQGQLLVAHTVFEIRPERTLERLYLAPLRAHLESHEGQVFAEGTGLWLLVDIKDRGEETYQALQSLLAEYADILSVTVEGKFERKPVTVVISGDCPAETIRRQKTRYAGIDGRPADLDRDDPVDQLPWISTDWKSHFRWRGTGEMPDDQRQQLREFVARAHARQRRLRFWGTPDVPAVWAELRAADVDLIGADNLAALQRFLRDTP